MRVKHVIYIFVVGRWVSGRVRVRVKRLDALSSQVFRTSVSEVLLEVVNHLAVDYGACIASVD